MQTENLEQTIRKFKDSIWEDFVPAYHPIMWLTSRLQRASTTSGSLCLQTNVLCKLKKHTIQNSVDSNIESPKCNRQIFRYYFAVTGVLSSDFHRFCFYPMPRVVYRQSEIQQCSQKQGAQIMLFHLHPNLYTNFLKQDMEVVFCFFKTTDQFYF